MLVTLWRKQPWYTIGGNEKHATIMEDRQKTMHMSTVWLISGYLPEGSEISIWKRYPQCHVHHSTNHSSQDTESTWVTISGWAPKEHVVDVHIVMLFSHEKGMKAWHLPEVNGTGSHYGKWIARHRKTSATCSLLCEHLTTLIWEQWFVEMEGKGRGRGRLHKGYQSERNNGLLCSTETYGVTTVHKMYYMLQ